MTDVPEHWPDPGERPAQYLGDVPPMRPGTARSRAVLRFRATLGLILVSAAAVLTLTAWLTTTWWVIVFAAFCVINVGVLVAGNRAEKIDRRRLDAYHWQLFDLDQDPELDQRID